MHPCPSCAPLRPSKPLLTWLFENQFLDIYVQTLSVSEAKVRDRKGRVPRWRNLQLEIPDSASLPAASAQFCLWPVTTRRSALGQSVESQGVSDSTERLNSMHGLNTEFPGRGSPQQDGSSVKDRKSRWEKCCTLSQLSLHPVLSILLT